MKKTIVMITILSLFLHHQKSCGDNIITFFIKPYPIDAHNEYTQSIVKKFGQPGKLAKQALYGLGRDHFVTGIFSSYAGYMNSSDINGQTSFPRKHAAPKVYLLITTKMTPIIMLGNTIHHWELEKGTPAQMLSAERKQDKETKLFYWDVQEVALPKDNRIPLEAIVVIAEPRHLYVPTGITPTVESANLILPPLYTKRGLDTLTNAFYLLNLKHFFGPVIPAYVAKEKSYSQQIKP